MFQAGTERLINAVRFIEESCYDTFEHINMNGIPLDIFLIYSIDPYSTQEENIRNAHIGAGEISQYISLMAAKDGFLQGP